MIDLLERLFNRAKFNKVHGFRNTEFQMPVNNALWGIDFSFTKLETDIKEFIYKHKGKKNEIMSEKTLEKLLCYALAIAEIIEEKNLRKSEYFIGDTKFRGQVFGIKRSPGWVLLLGDKTQENLVDRLKEKRFIIFSTKENKKTIYLGNRDTSIIYFIQNQLRYALIYGQIRPGNVHEMTHFIEDELASVIVINGVQSSEESLLALGAMLMGLPAIVTRNFPYLYGNRLLIDTEEEIVSNIMKFQNLRIIEHQGILKKTPDYCNPVNLSEKVDVVRKIGNTDNSYYAVRVADVDDGIEVIGGIGPDMGVLVELNHDGLKKDEINSTEYIELVASKYLRYIKGIFSEFSDNKLVVSIGENVNLTGKQIAETLHAFLKKRYVKLDKLKVTVIFDKEVLKTEKKDIKKYINDRRKGKHKVNEETMDEFFGCVACQPFTREHVCIVTPERPPMCGRDWREMMVGAYLNPEDIPDTLSRKRTRISPNSFIKFKKGKIIGGKKGEFDEINKSVHNESRKRISRVQIHSILGGYPHSSCSCFKYLAFYIKEVDGIGIMKRNYKGVAPHGMTWDLLANKAGGKQEKEITGVSLGYLLSKKFLSGDGGYKRVVWMDSVTKKQIESVIENHKIATERDVKNIKELKKFML